MQCILLTLLFHSFVYYLSPILAIAPDLNSSWFLMWFRFSASPLFPLRQECCHQHMGIGLQCHGYLLHPILSEV